jgi:hypothetical protein
MKKEIHKPKRAVGEKTREGVSQHFIEKVISLQKTGNQSK